jgi:hypothetical protein
VAKTFLLSQITYIGSILTPTADQNNTIQGLIDNFVLGGQPWSKKTLFAAREQSGLGLICVNDFLDSLKCAWFKRIHKSGINDNWRLRITKNSFFNPICFRPDQLDPSLLVEYGIGVAYWNFDARQLDERILGLEKYNRHEEGWLSLRLQDLLTGNSTGIKNF